MKIKTYTSTELYLIEIDIRKLIENGTIKEIISISNSSTMIVHSVKHSVILIYK